MHYVTSVDHAGRWQGETSKSSQHLFLTRPADWEVNPVSPAPERERWDLIYTFLFMMFHEFHRAEMGGLRSWASKGPCWHSSCGPDWSHQDPTFEVGPAIVNSSICILALACVTGGLHMWCLLLQQWHLGWVSVCGNGNGLSSVNQVGTSQIFYFNSITRCKFILSSYCTCMNVIIKHWSIAANVCQRSSKSTRCFK